MKRIKTPDYKDKNVFGVPLPVILQRTGQPLPQCILYAMRCLRRTARDAVGIFRKSGVRSRIQKLRNQLESDPGIICMIQYSGKLGVKTSTKMLFLLPLSYIILFDDSHTLHKYIY